MLSLLNISITSSGEGFRGYELLLYGGIQTVFGLLTFSHMLLALPWLGNITMLLVFISIHYKQGKQISLISALLGVICTLSFIFNPNVMLGHDLRVVTVDINVGAYMWFTSSVLLFFSALLIQEIPNKPFKQDK
jgi:hypothetical protein